MPGYARQKLLTKALIKRPLMVGWGLELLSDWARYAPEVGGEVRL